MMEVFDFDRLIKSMEHQKHYDRLIETRRSLNRSKSDEEYYEKHHIIPKALGGLNDTSNLVLLTAKEHYIAHWLLYKIYPDSNDTAYAFWKMTFPGSKFTKRNYKISSIAYSAAKTAMSVAQRRKNLGRKVDKKFLHKWKGNKNYNKPIVNLKTGEKYTNAKALWREKYEGIITYSAFNYYLRKKIKGSSINRKLKDETAYDWVYQ